MSEPLSLLMIDSDPMRRQALRELLKDYEHVKVEAEAATLRPVIIWSTN